MSRRIGVLTGEKQGIGHRQRHAGRCVECAGRRVAIGAARIGIRLPVVRVPADQSRVQVLRRDSVRAR